MLPAWWCRWEGSYHSTYCFRQSDQTFLDSWGKLKIFSLPECRAIIALLLLQAMTVVCIQQGLVCFSTQTIACTQEERRLPQHSCVNALF